MWGIEGCDSVDPQYPSHPPGSTESYYDRSQGHFERTFLDSPRMNHPIKPAKRTQTHKFTVREL